jgi:aminoglycoside phosphotransferase (APT) family kinase protein
MTGSLDRHPFEAVALRIEPGSRVLRTWELSGGVSGQVTAFELERRDGQSERLIVRRHGAADLARNPHLAADEFRLLRVLESAGVPAPKPRYLDPDGVIFATPSLVVDYIDGETPSPVVDVADFVSQLANVLADIHRVGSTGDVSFLPHRELTFTTAPAIAARPVQELLESVGPLAPRNRPVLLHGDFWPGNTLWNDGRLVGVIDWEEAAIGDPLADIANARLELTWALGLEAMEDFTQRYRSNVASVDFADLPYWDLWADLRLAGRTAEWGLEPAREAAMRAGHEAFIAQALARLQAQRSVTSLRREQPRSEAEPRRSS